MKSKACMILCLVICTAAQGQAVLTPQQVVSDTLAHSQYLKVLDREIDVAQSRKEQAKAQDLPTLAGSAQAIHYYGLGDSAFGPFVIPFIEDQVNATVTLTQPFYTGGRISSQKQIAEHRQAAARHTRQGAEADMIQQALTAYWNWSKAFHSVDSLKTAVERMEVHARDMQNLRQAGLATDNETLATEVLLDQTRLRLEEAQRRVQVAAARISFLTGQALAVEATPSKIEPSPDLQIPTEASLLSTAQAHREERAARIMEAKAAKAQVAATRADYAPQVSGLVRYEQARPNLMEIPPTDEWREDTLVGVRLTWLLFDWGQRRARVAEASARAAQARLQVDQTEEQISLEVREARINLQDANERVTVAHRVEQSAQRNLTAATNLWKNGLARHSDVLDAHNQLTSAQYEAIAAMADLELSKAALDHATGRLAAGAQPETQESKPR